MNASGELLLWIAPLWIIAVIGGSIVFRLTRGKPIFPKLPPDAVYRERAASGRSYRYAWSALGGAGNCLMVAVTGSELIVTPFFPFNLMFLPEIYGLELHAPLSQVRVENPAAGLLKNSVRLAIGGSNPHEIVLKLRKREAFLKALASTR